MVLFLFLSHLALGIVFTLALVSRQAGVKFFRFNAGFAAALLAAGLAFHPTWPGLPTSVPGSLRVAATVLVWTCVAALLGYWLIVGRMLPALRPLLLWTTISSGALAMVCQAWLVSWDRSLAIQLLTATSFLTSALFLGGASSSMVLGHWYLVIPSMDVSHLKSIVKVHIASIILRSAAVLAAIVLAIGTGQPGLGLDFQRYIFSLSGVFFWQRVLFGLAGPAVLAYLTWETAKIRSTQSATGILYVDFFAVIVGEVLAKYLLLETRVPV